MKNKRKQYNLLQITAAFCLLLDMLGTKSISSLSGGLPANVYAEYFRSEIISKAAFGLLYLVVAVESIRMREENKKTDYVICGVMAVLYIGDVVLAFL